MLVNPLVHRIVHANISVASGMSPTLILAANDRRIYVLIVNTSSSAMYIKLGSPPTSQTDGIYLAQGGFSLEIDRNVLWRGDIYAIHSSGTARIINTTEAW